MDTMFYTRLQLILSGAIDSNVVPFWTSTGQIELARTNQESKRLYSDENSSSKLILFSNTRVTIDKLYHSIRSYFDAENYNAGIIENFGTMHREQKLYHTGFFLNMNCVSCLGIEEKMVFILM